MYISYNWLKELTGTSLTPLELRERLTMVGLAIDAVDEFDGDYVLDVEVPSNRPDCLSHIGIAREVSVIESGEVHWPAPIPPRVEGRAEDFAAVEIRDPDLCPRYAARIIRNVKIAPSPDWLARRLMEIGQRPINNVADITNYVLHELGQPLHAFDLVKLDGRKIVVRRAVANEKLKTLDGIERGLKPNMLVIADAGKPVALAGIMGGEDSEISTATTDVLIESAYFDPESVRRTARELGMDTEASRRFERGADCEDVLRAQTRCVELICEIAGGTATEAAIDVYPNPLPARDTTLRPGRVEQLTSIHVAPAEILRILTGLGMRQKDEDQNGALTFEVPSWRADVRIEEDLIEEIARHTGYDKIASELPPSGQAGEYQAKELKYRALRRAFTAGGFDEAISFSFIESGSETKFEPIPAFRDKESDKGFVSLKNPIIENTDRMRPTLLPGLLNALRHNLNHGNRDVRLFEIGRIFANFSAGELPEEREGLALVASGGALEAELAQSARDLDFHDVKGALEMAVEVTKLGPLGFRSSRVEHLRPGQAASITLGEGAVIGSIGRLAEEIASTHKFRQPVFVAELDLTALLASPERLVHYRPLPRYPAVLRDVTLLVPRTVTVAELFDAIREEQVNTSRDVRLVGTYEGANIPEDRRSVTLRFEYRAEERTLRDEEVDELQRAIVDQLVHKFGAEVH